VIKGINFTIQFLSFGKPDGERFLSVAPIIPKYRQQERGGRAFETVIGRYDRRLDSSDGSNFLTPFFHRLFSK
jgi:hypothetical protein